MSRFFIAAIAASTAVGIDGFGGLWRERVSGQRRRNDPLRPKTPADLAALKAAARLRAPARFSC